MYCPSTAYVPKASSAPPPIFIQSMYPQYYNPNINPPDGSLIVQGSTGETTIYDPVDIRHANDSPILGCKEKVGGEDNTAIKTAVWGSFQ